MLSAADLEANVFEFRQRSFQFDRLAELADGPWAVFTRTETESERQLRPRLIRLAVVVPLAWIVFDEGADLLRLASEGPAGPRAEVPVVEVAAEPSQFEEGGRRWARRPLDARGHVYAPADRVEELLRPPTRAELGLG